MADSPLGRVVSAPSSRDARLVLRELLHKEGLAAIWLDEVTDPQRRQLIRAEAVRQLGEAA